MNDDVLIITEKDLFFPNNGCLGTTLKGKKCKNKTFEKHNYCKIHYEKFRLEKPSECPICFESLEQVKVPLDCGHWVHRSCLLKWRSICPVCRTDVKLTSKERKKIKKNEQPQEITSEIVVPENVLEYFYSILRSGTESIYETFLVGVVSENGVDEEFFTVNHEEIIYPEEIYNI